MHGFTRKTFQISKHENENEEKSVCISFSKPIHGNITVQISYYISIGNCKENGGVGLGLYPNKDYCINNIHSIFELTCLFKVYTYPTI